LTQFISYIAREFRNNPHRNTTLLPLIVDSEGDRMCFLLALPPKKTQEPVLTRRLDVRTHIPALKIHDSSYNIVESGENFEDLPIDLAETDLHVYYRPEAFPYYSPVDGSVNYDMINKHFKIEFEKIGLYRTNYFETFFWSSKATGHYLENIANTMGDDPAFLADLSKYRYWRGLYDYYSDMSNKDTAYGYGRYADIETDPCNYETLFRSVEYSEVQVLPYTTINNLKVKSNIMYLVG
jgi:hypothetical protein